MFKAIDKKKKSMNFDKYSDRKDISDGEYSAHQMRFLESPKTTFRNDNQRAQIGKYSMRSAKSQHGDIFSVEMQGIMYETGDNYAISQSLRNGNSSAPQFAHPSIWKS